MKRGEIYFGKGVILVEGIAEEYLVPRFAEILGMPLDEKGIVVCNVNSTNFKPYVKLLMELQIPFVVITDGDFYYENEESDEKGNEVITKAYHLMLDEDDDRNIGLLGHEIICSLIKELKLVKESEIPSDHSNQDALFRELDFFVGYYTLEVDIMGACTNNDSLKIIYNTFKNLTDGGDRQKQNFKNELKQNEYWKCLAKIESNGIGKGRFAQTFSTVCVEDHIPEYISAAIEAIYLNVEK